MSELKWSSDLKEVVIAQDTVTAEEALDILTKELLGEDYYVEGPIHATQCNAVIVRDILSRYKRKRIRFW
jgi:predicted acyltransferase (DUF342 family)